MAKMTTKKAPSKTTKGASKTAPVKAPKTEKAPRTPKAAKTEKPKKVVPGRIKPTDLIVILTEGKANPRREGTDAHAAFEAMKKSKTVADYMKACNLAAARQWLWNTVRDGHVKCEAAGDE
jgi:hypothetical protein